MLGFPSGGGTTGVQFSAEMHFSFGQQRLDLAGRREHSKLNGLSVRKTDPEGLRFVTKERTCAPWCGMAQPTIAATAFPDPEIEDGRDAIIKVTTCAICGSDLHLYDHFMPGMKSGDIMGHETMGEVVEIGKDNKRLKIGDRIVVPVHDYLRRMRAVPPGQFLGLRADQPEQEARR